MQKTNENHQAPHFCLPVVKHRLSRPILFSTEMVKAILEGRKTQTRRVFKINKSTVTDSEETVLMEGNEAIYHSRGGMSGGYPCPYGNIGDILWVRETFAETSDELGQPIVAYKVGKPWYVGLTNDNSQELLLMEADTEWDIDNYPSCGKWKPSIFMPYWACRIFLKIKSIRVERLQDISEEDAKAEGIQFHFEELFQEYRYRDYDKKLQKGYGHPDHDYPTWREAKSSFQSLWKSINGKESWLQNPFVWVVEFERTERP
jgi:hypothetical protein